MTLTAADKAQIVKKHARGKNDTGSPEVQVALLSERIQYLTHHLKSNKHDVHTRHGLTKLVSKRRRLLAYLKKGYPERYQALLSQLDVRGLND